MSPGSDEWTASSFYQANPAGSGQGDVPALLRRVADTVDELGDAHVQDICFHREIMAGEDRVSMNVYYHRPTDR